VKRLIDLLISLILLLFLAIPMLGIALLIYVNDGGPVFYRQTRIGMDCKTFSILKFRSMILNADQVGGYQTSLNDDRITSVGKFLRRTSLDELPQCLNVLMGHMSFVGPRPDVPAQETLYQPEDWQKRHKVRPGFTGLAQVNGRSSISFEERLAFDLEYVDKSSLMLDTKIILKTLSFVAKGF